MALNTLDLVLAGQTAPQPIFKVGVAMKGAGIAHSHLYSVGAPGAAVAPSPGVNGAALTTYLGQIPWTNPVSGISRFSRMALAASQPCTVLLVDRLWHNSGLSATLTSSQAITSPTWPSRDRNGATSGHGLLCGIEWSAAGGAGTPTITLGYTNQDGTSGKTVTLLGNTTPNAGTFEMFPLAAGDTGIRSIQSYQASATRTSGTFHLVVYRVIAIFGLPIANVAVVLDALSSGFPQCFDDSVPFLIQIPGGTTATNLNGTFNVTQG